MIICAELVYEWIEKGEVTPRYYNPCNTFNQIDFLLHDDDQVSEADLQILCGEAKIRIFRYSTTLLDWVQTGFWSPSLIQNWARQTLKRIPNPKYSAIRCYGADLNLVLGSYISRELNVPMLTSIHVNYDVSKTFYRNKYLTFIRHLFLERVRRIYLVNNKEIWPVYSPIIPYLKRLNLPSYKTVYNSVNPKVIEKANWSNVLPLKLITVGRLINEKSPEKIIFALKELKSSTLTIVGDGPLRLQLQELVQEIGLSDRVSFLGNISNTEICELLIEHDLCILYTEYFELSKVMIESLLSGVPIVLNKEPNSQLSEISEFPIFFVEESSSSYSQAIKFFEENPSIIQEFGAICSKISNKRWAPHVTEKAHAKAYLEVI